MQHLTWHSCRAIGAALVFAVAGLMGCGGGGQAGPAGFRPLEAGTLTVATPFPAAGFWEGADSDHVSGGFEYELALELVDRFGLERLRVVNVPFDQLIAGARTDFDLALAQVSITRERDEIVVFSQSYLTTPVAVVGRPGTDVTDLAGARDMHWGAATATTDLDVITDHIRPDREPKVFNDVAAALAAVAAGEVEVVALDYLRAIAEVANNPQLALVAQVNAPQQYGAVLPDGSENRSAVNMALRQLQAAGTLDDLEDDLLARHGVDPNEVPTIRVPGV